MTIDAAIPPLDIDPLAGFAYGCRPGCGLCCYAEPRVEPRDRLALTQIEPSVEFSRRGGAEFLRSRPDGGACGLLEGTRCRGHGARPSACREFPVTVHVGRRLQATVVLSCPGVDLAALDGYAGPAGAPAPRGFESELAAVRARLDAGVNQRIRSATLRARRIERWLAASGRWETEAAVRAALSRELPRPGPADFPAEEPPEETDGLEALPLVFAGRPAPVAFASGVGGWALLELRASGGVERVLGVVPPPTRPPALSDDAARTLRGYLRYWLERDVLFAAVHLAMVAGRPGTVAECVAAEVRRIGAVAVSRGAVLASMRTGLSGPLSRSALVDGIRATDQDLLDVETWGSRL